MNKINITAESIAQVVAAIKGTGPKVDYATYKAHVPAHVTKAGQVVAVAVAVTSSQFLNAVKGLMDNNLENLVIHSPLIAIANSEIGEFWGINEDICDTENLPKAGSPEDFENGNFGDSGYEEYGSFNTIRTNNHITSEATFGDNDDGGSLDETHKQFHLYQISPEDISTLFTVHGTVNGKELIHPLGAVLKENGISKLSAPITIASLNSFCPLTACPRHILDQTNELAAGICTTLQLSMDRLGEIIQEIGLPEECSSEEGGTSIWANRVGTFFKASANVSVPKDFIPLLIQEGSPFNILPEGVTASNLKFLDGEPYSFYKTNESNDRVEVTIKQGFSCDIHYGSSSRSLIFRRQSKRDWNCREYAFPEILISSKPAW